MNRNLGATSLKRKRRNDDPMNSYDALPEPLRHWLSQAVMPWSSASARRVWKRARAKGLTPHEALHVLANAEARTRARDRHSLSQILTS